jgi:dolichol-phosphate mannosyltransferase
LQSILVNSATYNEADNITTLLDEVAKNVVPFNKHNFEMFIIDDNSPDGTSSMVKEYAATHHFNNFKIRTIDRAGKEGYGKAYINGFAEVLKDPADFDYILTIDADLQHNPKYIADFVGKAEQGFDFINASRYIFGGVPNWKLSRKLLSIGGNMYTKLFLGSDITDYTGGYVMYSK